MRIDEVHFAPVWVNPGHLVETARIVMAGHRLKVIGVVDSDLYAGVLRDEDLVGRQDSETVLDSVTKPDVVLEADLRIEDAAELFIANDCIDAPVVRDGRFLGIVTSNMLLRELRRSRDPLTGLAWSDMLREWGTERLKEGSEITIVFIDLDDFGLYNKRYGHIIGDRVLKAFVDCLKTRIDPEKDVLVRYGGDEFVVGTLRTHREVSNLLQHVTSRTSAMEIGEGVEPVGFTLGLAGGRRTIERENLHFASTLDNLINLASRDCQARKASKTGSEAPAPQPQPSPIPPQAPAPVQRPSVVSIHDGRKMGGTLTTVIFSSGDAVVSGVDNRGEGDSSESTARASFSALERLLNGRSVTLTQVIHEEASDGSRLVTVVGTVSDGGDTPVSGTSPVQDDLLVAVAEATISAYLSA